MVDKEGLRIYFLALVEKNLSVGTLSSAYEEYQIVAGGKVADVRHPVGYLTADGIVIFKCSIRRNVLLDVFYNLAEFI